MALQTTTQIYISGTPILSYVRLELVQEIDAHHDLELACRRDVIEQLSEDLIGQSKEYLGAVIAIQISASSEFEGYKELEFKGVITRIKGSKGASASSGEIVTLYAKSASILCDDGGHYSSFNDEGLSDILEYIFRGYDTNKLETSFSPVFREAIHYSVQNNQSAFSFASRLASYYNEWFYYDGKKLVFGSPSQDETVLTSGIDLHNFSVELSSVPNSFGYATNDYLTDELHKKSSSEVTIPSGGYHAFTNAKSKEIFSKETEVYHHLYNDGSLKRRFDTQVEQHTKALAMQQVIAKGSSDNPGVNLGEIVKIEGYGSYRIIKIIHSNIEGGGYRNHFVGVDASFDTYPKMNMNNFPKSDIQIAKVMENNDPDGLSRIRVQFPWQKPLGEMTPWLRMMTPHAGADKGFHFIPEVGEEVVVNFEGGNAERPFIAGAMYNGIKNASDWKTDNNDIKAIKTRSGHIIEFNDTKNAESIIISDKNKNIIHLDTANKNIKIKAFNKIDLTANDIILNATNNLAFNSANNAEINVSNNFVINAMTKLLIFAPYLKQTVSGFMHLFSGKALINSLNSISIESKEVKTLGSEKVFIHSDEKTVINSKGIAEMHGTKKNSFTNNAFDAQLLPSEEIAIAIVEFRTEEGIYNGEFGFDWLRIDEPGLTSEPSYESIIEGGYKDGITDLSGPDAFKLLLGEYKNQIPIKPKIPTVLPALPVTPKKYYVPYLNLYSKLTSETVKIDPIKPPYKAKLRVLVEIEEDIDKLEFDYDKNIFTIDKPILADKTASPKQASVDGTIEITCKELIDTEEKGKISIYAYPKGSAAKTAADQIQERKLAGRIMVGRNDRGYRKKAKIVLIKVKTDIVGGSPLTGSFSITEKENLRNTFYQVLTYTQMEEAFFDLSKEAQFQTGGSFISRGGIKLLDFTTGEVFKPTFEFLKTEFIRQNPKYTGYYPVFAFDEVANYPRAVGSVKEISVKNIILFNTRRPSTLSHEVVHGLGLYHTHRDGAPIKNSNRKYTFNERTTDNLISYSTSRKTTLKWQWDIFKPNI